MRDPKIRFSRQHLLPEIGVAGQEKLARAAVLVVGCGALGAAAAQLLARAGVGRLRLVDRDVVEIQDLHRQILYDEADAEGGLPKAVAAQKRLAAINSDVTLEAHVTDVAPRTVEQLLVDIDAVIDGTDNVETRYLLNDACLDAGIPWVYGGAVGTSGMCLPLRPGAGPCLRCLFPEPAPPGALPTCDSAGVLNALPTTVASLQVAAALRILVGDPPPANLTSIDPWHGSCQQLPVRQDPACPACGHGQRDFLHELDATQTVRLCGRNAVQVDPPQALAVSLEQLHDKLAHLGDVAFNGHTLRLTVEGLEVVLFADGRAQVRGTTDPSRARRLYAELVGM